MACREDSSCSAGGCSAGPGAPARLRVRWRPRSSGLMTAAAEEAMALRRRPEGPCGGAPAGEGAVRPRLCRATSACQRRAGAGHANFLGVKARQRVCTCDGREGWPLWRAQVTVLGMLMHSGVGAREGHALLLHFKARSTKQGTAAASFIMFHAHTQLASINF